jgi:hypothetical protein
MPVRQVGKTRKMMKQTESPTTHVALLLDKSGSMQRIAGDAVRFYNDTIRSVRDRASELHQDVRLTTVLFNDRYDVKQFDMPAPFAAELSVDSYFPQSQTALRDTTGAILAKLLTLQSRPGDAFLLIVVTDGEDTCSWTFGTSRLRDAIAEAERRGNWTVVFQVPPGAADRISRDYGIPRQNIREWEATSAGMAEAHEFTSGGITNYMAARSTGATKVDAFFADLGKITDDDLRAQLTPQGKRFRVTTVEKECVIKDFVEEKTHKPYVIGSAYYELTKPEKVQAGKDVLIVERGNEKKEVFGGPAARKLIGLPVGSDAKLKIANLSKWRAFIQSTSTNRKLVRGTLLLIDKEKTVSDEPTWAPDPSKAMVVS